MTQTDLAALTERLDRLERTSKSIELAAWSLVALLVLAGAVVSAMFWGPAPIAALCTVVALALAVGAHAGRRAEEAAQAHLDRVGSDEQEAALDAALRH